MGITKLISALGYANKMVFGGFEISGGP